MLRIRNLLQLSLKSRESLSGRWWVGGAWLGRRSVLFIWSVGASVSRLSLQPVCIHCSHAFRVMSPSQVACNL